MEGGADQMKESAGLKVKWKEVPTEGLMEGGDGFKIKWLEVLA